MSEHSHQCFSCGQTWDDCKHDCIPTPGNCTYYPYIDSQLCDNCDRALERELDEQLSRDGLKL